MSDPAVVRDWLAQAARVIASIDAGALADATHALVQARARQGTIWTIGNGGSASTASHLALDLQKAARPDGQGTRAICLNDSMGLVTAWANDESFDDVFKAQLEVLARPGDALVVFSVSGSSPNLVAAVAAAREMQVVTIGFLGKKGGRMRDMVDHAVVVPSDDYGWVESAHLVLEHVVTYALRDAAATQEAR